MLNVNSINVGDKVRILTTDKALEDVNDIVNVGDIATVDEVSACKKEIRIKYKTFFFVVSFDEVEKVA